MPPEQPCAGCGTCSKCTALVDDALSDCDDIESKFLLPTKRAANIRLACCAQPGIVPNFNRERIELIVNGAGLGAATFLSDDGFIVEEELALRTIHIELDLDSISTRGLSNR